jgi:hypothetical protein
VDDSSGKPHYVHIAYIDGRAYVFTKNKDGTFRLIAVLEDDDGLSDQERQKILDALQQVANVAQTSSDPTIWNLGREMGL